MAAMLGSSRVSGFPVIDQAGKVIGVVSETDMLIKEADRASHPEVFTGLRRSRDHQKAAGVTAAELMTSPPVTIGPDEPVQHAAFLMYDRAVERLPVVDEAGHLVGIVSQVDVLSIFSRPDEEIRREVTDRVIRQGFRIDPERLKVTVHDGIVTLSGRPKPARSAGTSSRLWGTSRASWPSGTSWALRTRTTICTRPHRSNASGLPGQPCTGGGAMVARGQCPHVTYAIRNKQ